MVPSPATRRVAVWKDGWLPPSETFIRDQLAAMSSWSPIRAGYYLVGDGINEHSVIAPYGTGALDRITRYLLGTRLHRSVWIEGLRQAEVMHAHFGQGGVHAAPLARKLRIPLVVTFHGQDATRYGNWGPVANAIYLRQLRRLFNQAKVLIAISQYVADQLVATGAPPSKILVMYTGTKIPQNLPVRTRQGIVFVGRLIEMKGVSDLITALDLLKGAGIDVRTTIIGDGPLRVDLEDRVRALGLDVEFTGMLPSAEVRERLLSARVLCAPSHSTRERSAEGFGMVYAEAAAHGVPVVAYRAGGTREAVSDSVSGVLVAERDTNALAGALARLLQDSGWADELGRGGRARASQMFDIDKQTRSLEELYTRVATNTWRQT